VFATNCILLYYELTLAKRVYETFGSAMSSIEESVEERRV
jgi:hypothetical protein